MSLCSGTDVLGPLQLRKSKSCECRKGDAKEGRIPQANRSQGSWRKEKREGKKQGRERTREANPGDQRKTRMRERSHEGAT